MRITPLPGLELLTDEIVLDEDSPRASRAFTPCETASEAHSSAAKSKNLVFVSLPQAPTSEAGRPPSSGDRTVMGRDSSEGLRVRSCKSGMGEE